MLELLTIEDFQAHRKLEIHLDPAITTIVGPSDVGKSAVIRALIWLMTNRPLGDSFIRDGAGPARVTLAFDDGRVIVRTRGKTTNSYEVDGEELKAFGNDPPTEVTQLLNLSSINFQHQHDSPFWFSLNGGDVSKELNKIVDLTIIDRTLSNLNKASLSTAAEIRTLETQEEDAKTQRSDLAWAKQADEGLRKVERLEEVWGKATKSHRRLAERIEAVRLHKETAEQLGRHEEAAGAVLRSGSWWEEFHKQTSSLRRLIAEVRDSVSKQRAAKAAEILLQTGLKWEKVRDRLDRLRRLTREVRNLITEVRQPVPDLIDILQLSDAAVKAKHRVILLRGLLNTARLAQGAVSDATKGLETAETSFHEQLGKECPLCGAKIKS